jgi:UDP-GlcNAc:undecaprenyl-phosphate GlcNAc-1-phosphate transferase
MTSLFPDLTLLLAAFGGAFAISWVVTAALLYLAPRWGLVDHPAARKIHARPTPKGGGLAIFLAVAAPGLLFYRTNSLAFLLGLGLVIVVVGLVDDLRPLSWQVRLVVQIAAAVIATAILPPGLDWGVRTLAVVWIVGLTNAFNMLDNMDALSGGVAWIAAGALALVVLGGLTPDPATRSLPERALQRVLPLFLLMGALSGFLWFNRPPARIFMGDAGSTFLGFFLGVWSLGVAESAECAFSWAPLLCVFAVPWYDLVSVVLIRLSQGRSPFHADKQHLSHRLVELGLSRPAAVLVIYLLALASGLGGVVLYQLDGTRAALLVGVLLACWWLAIAGIELGVRQSK